ncbi:GDSL-type esterase/lipase family protein [Neobacillus drentensis]|uniref:GDSL-type esterase/lipase family protein n=1 Tax=Neobacillus drentensis TaxID=220684 RepID=UPI001F3DD14C|nr:GDSL-type esterase/lipase family protein [Neobacillus drentensis]ULT56172.1 GDSL-type esterase/lipase family protein [Neobacillus drentensis]
MENLEITPKWVGSWSVSPVDFNKAPLYLNNQTLRARIKLSIGGTKIRLKFSNRFGHQPIFLSGVSVALSKKDSDIAEGTNRVVTFNGEPAIMIMPNQEVVLSDEVDIKTVDLGSISISLFFSGKTKISTAFLGSSQCFTSVEGDYTDSSIFPIAKEADNQPALPLLTGVDVLNGEEYSSVVTFGDSITAMDWPGYLAERLVKAGKKIGVLRQAIGGNKVLNDSPESLQYGTAGIQRFRKDVVHQTGAKYIVVLHGVNDIIHSCGPHPISKSVKAEEIINGLHKYIQWAHESNMKILGATIMPFGGYAGNTSLEEEKRQAVNHWIRTSGKFDGVIDFDAATQNPEKKNELLPDYDSGDHLHPSKQGAKAMSDFIDLDIF